MAIHIHCIKIPFLPEKECRKTDYFSVKQEYGM